MMTLAAFRAEYPEFDATADGTVEAKLAAAETRTDRDALGDDADAAQGLLAAHLLALSPHGMQARKDASDTTTYYAEWQRLARARCGGPRVIR